MRALGELAPRFRLVLGPQFSRSSKLKLRLPFRKSRRAILISGVFLIVFSYPLLEILGSTTGNYDGELFSLVSVLFTIFWSLGWSVGVFILALVFLALSFGRETLEINEDNVRLLVGLPGIGFGIDYGVDLIRNLKTQSPDAATGTGWRGDHLAFEFAGDKIGFGSAITATRAGEILAAMKTMLPAHADPLPELKFPELETSASNEKYASLTGKDSAQREAESTALSTGHLKPRSKLSALALMIANLIPLLGVLVWDWRIGDIMLLYWAESAVIGFYNLLKIQRVAGWGIVFFGPFFIGHYGGFMVGHLLFIYGFFGDNFSNSNDVSVAQLLLDFQGLAPALLGFFISHGVSYFTNFLGRREYLGIEVAAQMGQPYRRIIIMHVTIIFGGFLVMAFSSALPALLLLIALKVGADLKGHFAERVR